MRILFVDDQKDNGDLFGTGLPLYGHRVDVAHGGEEALEKYTNAKHSKCPYSLLILDLAMPFTNGFEVAQKIREAGDKETCIMFLSAHDLQADKRLEALSTVGLLQKPITVEELHVKIQEVAAGC